MKNIYIIFFLIIISFAFVKCGTDTKSMKDNAGKEYKTVKIGKQIWMAENMDYKASNGSWCYDEDSLYCEKYGRLYTWETACTVCPDGWHLPSAEEWEDLIKYLSAKNPNTEQLFINEDIVSSLISEIGWDKKTYQSNKVYNKSGFAALPGGYRYYDGKYYNLGSMGIWWSSSKLNISEDVYRCVYFINNKTVGRDFVSAWYGASVRCVKDSI
jgi:uncharacterized protein (TIGR02145 family)